MAKKNPASPPATGIVHALKSPMTTTIVGMVLIFSALFILLACISFLISWTHDQSALSKPFWRLMADPDFQVNNVLGKLGAATGHQLVYRWTGLASVFVPWMLLLSGLRLTFRRPIPLGRRFRNGLLIMTWWSALFGFALGTIWPLAGGMAGLAMSAWLVAAMGPVGMVLLLLVTGLAYLALRYRWTPEKMAFWWASAQERMSSKAKVPAEDALSAQPVPDPEPVVVVPEPDALVIEMPAEEPVVIPPPVEMPPVEEPPFVAHDVADPPIEVEQAPAEELADEDEIKRRLREFGEYDPTLDLSRFKLPHPGLLQEHGNSTITIDQAELEDNKKRILDTLGNYGIEISKIKATIGPTVTLYEIVPAAGVRISKIKNLEDDIALNLAALGIRIIAPIPGRGTIGIEVPNAKPTVVSMKNLVSSERFQASDFELPVVLGKTINNETFLADLAKMPHLLMAGATGQGKSVGLNVILSSLLFKKHPAQVKFVLVDPKKVELTLFNKIERHYLAKLPGQDEAIITDTRKVINTLNSLCMEMDDRYELLKNAMVRNIKEYNQKFTQRRLNPEEGHRYLPYIVLVIDEFADLIMTAGKEVETPIARLAQLARAIGIHLIIATQRPSVNVITGIIKANFPARIAFRVTSKIDSRTILDMGGADQLIGKGDMLFSTGNDLIRIQCAFIDTPEVEQLTEYIGSQQGYPEAYQLPEYEGEDGGSEIDGLDPSERDKMFADAARVVVIHQQGSASLLQRKLKLGYNRAGRIIDQLEAAGVVGPFTGSKARQVLIQDEASLEQLLNRGQ